jgi:hypothetical protein
VPLKHRKQVSAIVNALKQWDQQGGKDDFIHTLGAVSFSFIVASKVPHLDSFVYSFTDTAPRLSPTSLACTVRTAHTSTRRSPASKGSTGDRSRAALACKCKCKTNWGLRLMFLEEPARKRTIRYDTDTIRWRGYFIQCTLYTGCSRL